MSKDPNDILKGTALNPVMGMTEDLDTSNPYESESMYAGDSVDEHVTIEQANQYLGEKEIKQVYDNS